MTALEIETSSALYALLHAEAERGGKPAQRIVHQEWPAERLPTLATANEQEQIIDALRTNGLLAETRCRVGQTRGRIGFDLSWGSYGT